MFRAAYEEDYLDFYDSSKCIGDIGEKWCNFKWRIYHLQLCPERILQSPVFTTRLLPDTQWYLEVELLSPGYLSALNISLCRLQNQEKVALIVDVIYKVTCDEQINQSVKKIIEYNNKLPSNDRIFSASFYKSEKNYITVECKMRPNKNMIGHVCHSDLDEALPIHLRKLLLTGELSDTIIRVGDHRLVAHIAILEARLPTLLKKCLAPKNVWGKHIVDIKDLPFSVVKEMLKYAYTGQGYLDLESVSVGKDLIVSYSQNFFQRCCWEDHLFARTSFNYETDSFSWPVKDGFTKSNARSHSIGLLRHFPSKIIFTLEVDGSEKDEKSLMITFNSLSVETPKPTLVHCNAFLANTESDETFRLGESEILLPLNVRDVKLKLCTLRFGQESFEAAVDPWILQLDFKFCYGSSKSSIENLYEGQFDISKCSGCPQLSADMGALLARPYYWNIIVESGDGHKFNVHKAILLARCPVVDGFEVTKNNHVILVGSKAEDLRKFFLQLYKGTV